MIAIIDYGAGNLFGVSNALKQFTDEVYITSDKDIIRSADHVILPGVGSFDDAMGSIKKSGLIETVYETIDRKKPFLGICVGLQMCFEKSEEGVLPGLGIFPGEIKKFPVDVCKKVPQIGWNRIEYKESPLFCDLPDDYFYFVHSYYLEAKNREEVIAASHYGIPFDCAYQRENVFLTQFHPEKSGKTGLKLLENFLKMKNE